MADLAAGRWGAQSARIRDLALRIVTVTGIDAKDYRGEVDAIHAWMQRTIRYTRDPIGQERVQTPEHTAFVVRAGDCDDFAVIVASCIQAVGGRARIVHGFSGSSGHAWAELWLGDGERGRAALARAAKAAGRPGWTPAHTKDAKGGVWLVLDWKFGELSMRASRVELAWTGD